MKTVDLFLISVIFPVSLCNCAFANVESAQGKPIYTITYTYVFDDLSRELVLDETEKNTVNSEYFEISLYELVDPNKGYSPKKEIYKSEIGVDEEYKSITMHLVDQNDGYLFFKTTTDFLNYMSAHDYEMIDQMEHKYRTDYTFKKTDEAMEEAIYYPEEIISKDATATYIIIAVVFLAGLIINILLIRLVGAWMLRINEIIRIQKQTLGELKKISQAVSMDKRKRRDGDRAREKMN